MAKASPKVADLLDELRRNGHAAHAIWVAAHLEQTLEALLSLYMPNLSNRLKERLFTGMGPMNSFSAKIDIAYALDLIPQTLRKDLHVIREIRNAFAHTAKPISFDTDDMLALLKKFSDYDPRMDRLAFYMDKLEQIRTAVEPGMSTLAITKALRERNAKRKSPQERSPLPSPRQKPQSRDDSGKAG